MPNNYKRVYLQVAKKYDETVIIASGDTVEEANQGFLEKLKEHEDLLCRDLEPGVSIDPNMVKDEDGERFKASGQSPIIQNLDLHRAEIRVFIETDK